jgi:hypothetical protein
MTDPTRADEPTVRPKRVPGRSVPVECSSSVDAHGSASGPTIAPKSAAGSGAAVPRPSAPGIHPKSDDAGPEQRISPKRTARPTPTARNHADTNGESRDR